MGLESRGIVNTFAQHPVAGNLMMLLMVLFGIYGLTSLNRQVMPDFTVDVISIDVQWPGASPQDIEANIVEAIEPEVRFLDNVKRVDSVAFEGRAGVNVQFKDGADLSKALTDIQAAIARITTFPSDMERPVISQVVESDKVCRLEITGPFPEESLKEIAKKIRDDILDLGLANVELVGMRNSEIWAEVPASVLRQLDLTVNDIALRVSQASLDLPSGSIESGGVSRQIRSDGLARTAAEVGEIEVVSNQTGEKLRLKDIARIYDTFEEGSVSRVLEGSPSVGLVVWRSKGVDSIDSQQLVTQYVDELRQVLPPTLQIDMFDVFADTATQRVRMLLWNGFGGLLLVVAILFVFLNGRVAFWVAMGIPISIMATLGGMSVMGITLNMISMFAIIMGLGIIVDDAIVVAEHAEMLHRHGIKPEQAALQSAQTMRPPVLAASLTTIAAFAPILTIGEAIGEILRDLPLTIILVILASLVECFLVLPMHLKKAMQRMERVGAKKPSKLQIAFNRFRDIQVKNAVRWSFRRRYSTVLAFMCTLIIAVSMLATGRVGFEFFATPETDIIFANFAFSPGTLRDQTRKMISEVARSVDVVENRLTNGSGGLVKQKVGVIGSTETRQGAPVMFGDHVGAYTVELISSDDRYVRNTEFIDAWRQEIRPIAGMEKLIIFELSAGGPPGRDLDIRLHSADLATLKAAAMKIREVLLNIPGTMVIEDNLPYGKQAIVLELTSVGRAMGFTTEAVARQVRNSFEGAIGKRFSRNQEEIIVRVKLQESPNIRASIRDLYLRASDGSEVPLTEVVSLKTQIGFSQVRREDGQRQVSVTADVDQQITTTNRVIAELSRNIIPAVEQEFGIQADFKGRAEEQQAALGDTQVALMIALAVIYVILAWVFASYTTPLVVMSVIPFGLVGAIIGHWVMGFNLNMLSLQALLGLFGVMINDSIILVSAINRARSSGAELTEAILVGTRERLRPVLLTTLTTIGGLTPLLFERSLQAQLVQPLAITLIFGLLFSLFLVLFFVPAVLGIGDDMKQKFLRRGPVGPEHTAESHA